MPDTVCFALVVRLLPAAVLQAQQGPRPARELGRSAGWRESTYVVVQGSNEGGRILQDALPHEIFAPADGGISGACGLHVAGAINQS